MYDRAETAAANDRLWAAARDNLRAAGIAAPDGLTRGIDDLLPHWLSPDLLLSQACGFPYRSRLHGQVTLVGTPDYGVEGCPPGYYRSVFVARAGDAREALADFDGASLAYNDPLSQSGWAAPQTHAARLGLRFSQGPCSGAHRLSAQTVAAGHADLAALDAVSWRLIQRHDPGLAAQLRVVALTDPTPGLPCITARTRDAKTVFAALAAAIAGLAGPDRATLGLHGLIALPAAQYLAVPTPPPPAHFAPIA